MIFIAVIVAIVCGLSILQGSSNKDKRETQEAATNHPEHVVVSGTPSLGAVVMCVLIVAVIVIAAVHG